MKRKTNGWGTEIQQQCPAALSPLYLLGPPLVGEGDILSLLIAAVGQDIDDGDLIHTYKDTGCEELLNHML